MLLGCSCVVVGTGQVCYPCFCAGVLQVAEDSMCTLFSDVSVRYPLQFMNCFLAAGTSRTPQSDSLRLRCLHNWVCRCRKANRSPAQEYLEPLECPMEPRWRWEAWNLRLIPSLMLKRSGVSLYHINIDVFVLSHRLLCLSAV